MAKARSPIYPSIGLKEAIERVKLVYSNDYTNQVSREVIAQHMGYSGLSGKSLGVLSALGKYGLLEGRADSTRVSALAVRIIAHEVGSPERLEALREAALMPELFRDIDERSQCGRGSDAALRAWLQTEGFIPAAADSAIRAYRETKSLIEAESGGESEVSSSPSAAPSLPLGIERPPVVLSSKPGGPRVSFDEPGDAPLAGMRKAVFTLAEGDVILVYPEELSAESVTDLDDYLKVTMRKIRRDAGAG